jgi:hypothetical protein
MDKNELIAKMPQPIGNAYFQFQEKYLFSRSLWLAAGCALGVLAVKGYDSWRGRQEERLDHEIEQFYIDNSHKRDAA